MLKSLLKCTLMAGSVVSFVSMVVCMFAATLPWLPQEMGETCLGLTFLSMIIAVLTMNKAWDLDYEI